MTDINIKNKNWKLAKDKKCESCGSRKVQTSKQIKVFNYGTLDKPVKLRVEVPVYSIIVFKLHGTALTQ